MTPSLTSPGRFASQRGRQTTPAAALGGQSQPRDLLRPPAIRARARRDRDPFIEEAFEFMSPLFDNSPSELEARTIGGAPVLISRRSRSRGIAPRFHANHRNSLPTTSDTLNHHLGKQWTVQLCRPPGDVTALGGPDIVPAGQEQAGHDVRICSLRWSGPRAWALAT
jgi:hypothetical protein